MARVFLGLFVFGHPLVTAASRWNGNIYAQWALLGAGLLFGGLVWFAARTEPLCWARHGRLAALLGVGVSVYGAGMVLATWGMYRWDGVFLPLLAVALTAVFLRPTYWESLCARPVRCAVLGLAGWLLVVSVLSGFQAFSFAGSDYRRTGVVAFLGCLAVFLAVLAFVRTPDEKRRLLAAMGAGGAVVAVVALWQFFAPDRAARWYHELFRDPRPVGTLGQTNWMGAYLCLIFPPVLALFLEARTIPARLASAGCCALLFACLLVGQTRGAWLALGAFLVWAAWSQRRLGRKLAGLYVLLALVAAVLIPSRDAVIYHRMWSLGDEVDRASAGASAAGSGRFGFWKYGLVHLPAYALQGAGLDTFEQIGLKDPVRPVVDKAHSIYVEYAVTLGLFGLGLWLYFLWKCRAALSADPRNLLAWGLRASLAVYLVQGLFIHDTIRSWPILWIILGLAVSKERSASESV
jgi:O-antigen ligase